jgi:hypothetical protein
VFDDGEYLQSIVLGYYCIRVKFVEGEKILQVRRKSSGSFNTVGDYCSRRARSFKKFARF